MIQSPTLRVPRSRSGTVCRVHSGIALGPKSVLAITDAGRLGGYASPSVTDKASGAADKGKPRVTVGRKAMGPSPQGFGDRQAAGGTKNEHFHPLVPRWRTGCQAAFPSHPQPHGAADAHA